MKEKKLQPVPEVGKEYHFWDDGKSGPGRHYICRVEELIKPKAAKKIMLDYNDEKVSLYEIWKYEINTHRNSEGFRVIGNGAGSEPGSPWLYDEDTDWFVRISCPIYDENDLYAVRTVWGGWFTLNIQSWWQGGDIDVTGEKFESIINEWELNGDDTSAYFEITYDKN